MPADALREPPATLWQALQKIGPGIILAGSIIGSGELLLTTSLGAEYGFPFLWLILFSCVIKVFVQIELGRHAISSGMPTLGAINELPGPRLVHTGSCGGGSSCCWQPYPNWRNGGRSRSGNAPGDSWSIPKIAALWTT